MEVGESLNQRKDHSSSRVSMFDRVEASSLWVIVFDRLNTTYLTQNRDTLAGKSVFDRLGATKRPVDSHSQNSINFEVQREKKANDEIRNSIPSRMKCNSTLDISTEGSLKVKRRTIVHISRPQGANWIGIILLSYYNGRGYTIRCWSNQRRGRWSSPNLGRWSISYSWWT